MDPSSRSASVEQSEVITVSDESDASPSNYQDDVDGDDELASPQVQDGGAVVTDPHHAQCDASVLVRDDAMQYGTDGSMEDDEQQGAECKHASESLPDQAPVSHAIVDMHRPVEVVFKQDGRYELKPHNDIVFVPSRVNEGQVTVMPTVAYNRGGRARRGWNRRSPGGTDPRAEDPGQVVCPPRGGGRGRGRGRARGPRFVAPLSLRQFYDVGGRDYVDYLMRHIQSGAGESRSFIINI